MGVRGSMCEESDRNGLEHFCPWSGVKPPLRLPYSARSVTEPLHDAYQ